MEIIMKKMFALVGSVLLLFNGVFATPDPKKGNAIAASRKFSVQCMEYVQKLKTGVYAIESKTNDDYCTLIRLNKYLLAENLDTLSQIDAMEALVDSKRTFDEIDKLDVRDVVKNFGKDSITLVEEILQAYRELRLNKRFVFWRYIKNSSRP